MLQLERLARNCEAALPLGARPRASVIELALDLGSDAMSFLAVESNMRHWFDAEPGGTGACVAAPAEKAGGGGATHGRT